MLFKMSALAMISSAIAHGPPGHGKHGKHGGGATVVVVDRGVGAYGGYGVGGYGGYGAIGGYRVGGFRHGGAIGWKSTAPVQYISPPVQYAAPMQYAPPVTYAPPMYAAPAYPVGRLEAPIGYPANALEASSGSGYANFQHMPIQDEVVHVATYDGPVTESVKESNQVQLKKVVTHHPVYYKNYLDHTTEHQTVNEDVYHHIGEEEARYFDVAGQVIGGGAQHIDHGKIGMASYGDIVGQYGVTSSIGGGASSIPLVGLDSTMLNANPESFEYRRSAASMASPYRGGASTTGYRSVSAASPRGSVQGRMMYGSRRA